MSESEKRQSVRVIVYIKRVWLAVRFSCKLAFIIRNELSEKIAQTENTYSLSRGECLVNQPIYFDLPLDLLSSRCRKLKLILMMISANGMVPAGFAAFTTHPKTPYEQFQVIMPLERCEDVRAQVKFMHMYQHSSKTPIQISYINHLLNRQHQYRYENGGGSPKVSQKNSYSASRENISPIRYTYKQLHNKGVAQKLNFSKPLVSPRTLTRAFEGNPTQNSEKTTPFERGLAIAEEKQLNDSSINPLTKEQLMKEHQEYWLEIIRLEDELETIKDQNRKTSLENQALRKHHEGLDQKINLFVGEIQQSRKTIKILSQQLEQERKERERKQKQLKKCESALLLKNKPLDQEIAQQKILFLQNEIQKRQGRSLSLQQKVRDYEDQLHFLTNSIQTQKKSIIDFQSKIADYKEQCESQSSLKMEIQRLREEYKSLKESVGQSSSIEFSKLKIFEKEVETCSRQNEDLRFKLRQRQQQIFQLKNQYEELSDQSKMQCIKLIQYEASLSGKSNLIEELKSRLNESKDGVDDKMHHIDEQSEETELLHPQKQQNHEASRLSNNLLEDTFSNKSHVSKTKEEFMEHICPLQAQIQKLKLFIEKEDNRHHEQLKILKNELLYSQQQLNNLMEKASDLQIEHQTALLKLDHKEARNSTRDQYQDSYNQSMTALTLKNAKLEMELKELKDIFQNNTKQTVALSQKLQQKDSQIFEIKAFIHSKLQENLRMKKQNQELRSKSNSSLSKIQQFQATIVKKQEDLLKLRRQCQNLNASNNDKLVRIQQLTSQLQFVTEVLQRERQQKSDIQKEIDNLDKNEELPHITEVGQLKEESFESSKVEEGSLEIESKVISSEESIKGQREHNKKKKKKR